MARFAELQPGVFRVMEIPLRGLERLEAGAYQPTISPDGMYFYRIHKVGDGLIESNHIELRKAVERFWACVEIFKKLDLVYKRGVLLYGKAGCGKTSLINQFSEEVTKGGGITLFWAGSGITSQCIEALHTTEPDRNIIVIIEDIDQQLRRDSGILEYLDGYRSQPHVLNIATTNYLEQLPDTIRKRPSRFDTVIEIAPPTEGVRRVYMEGLFGKLELPLDERYVVETEGLSFAEMKELFIATMALEQDFKATLGRFKTVGALPEVEPSLLHNPHDCGESWEDCEDCQAIYDNDKDECRVACEECGTTGLVEAVA